ncbi:MAG: zinc metalloprotease HtpX [Chloroflexi bacterium]|nr:zinc metalloprotease HtpX [Chloroflexota bacterium]
MSTANMFKTVMLLTALTVLLLFIGQALAGTDGLVMALVLALLMNFGTYWFSDKIALKMAGAKEVSPHEAGDLHSIVSELSRKAGIPKPRVYIIPTDSPNAFATGRDPAHAAVAVTSGILSMLSYDELRGVIAHELGHIKNRDTLTMTATATIAGAITFIAQMAQWSLMFGGLGGRDDEHEGSGAGGMVVGLLMMILAPIAATIIQLAISRAREFEADGAGAKISGMPLSLANALEKLEAGVHNRPMHVPEAAAHLFIVNPLGQGFVSNLFRTHPTTAERVVRLRSMAMV